MSFFFFGAAEKNSFDERLTLLSERLDVAKCLAVFTEMKTKGSGWSSACAETHLFDFLYRLHFSPQMHL